MKLDKIKFANLVAYIVGLRPEYDVDCYQLDKLTEINVEPVSTGFVEAEKVDELLRCCMQERLKGGIIPAIKAYRALTNAGLKEAKEAVEKHCAIFPPEKI
jgi:ribosomal protein L7/L12